MNPRRGARGVKGGGVLFVTLAELLSLSLSLTPFRDRANALSGGGGGGGAGRTNTEKRGPSSVYSSSSDFD